MTAESARELVYNEDRRARLVCIHGGVLITVVTVWICVKVYTVNSKYGQLRVNVWSYGGVEFTWWWNRRVAESVR